MAELKDRAFEEEEKLLNQILEEVGQELDSDQRYDRINVLVRSKIKEKMGEKSKVGKSQLSKFTDEKGESCLPPPLHNLQIESKVVHSEKEEGEDDEMEEPLPSDERFGINNR